MVSIKGLVYNIVFKCLTVASHVKNLVLFSFIVSIDAADLYHDVCRAFLSAGALRAMADIRFCNARNAF